MSPFPLLECYGQCSQPFEIMPNRSHPDGQLLSDQLKYTQAKCRLTFGLCVPDFRVYEPNMNLSAISTLWIGSCKVIKYTVILTLPLAKNPFLFVTDHLRHRHVHLIVVNFASILTSGHQVTADIPTHSVTDSLSDRSSWPLGIFCSLRSQCGHPCLTEVDRLIDFCRRDVLQTFSSISGCSQFAAVADQCILTGGFVPSTEDELLSSRGCPQTHQKWASSCWTSWISVSVWPA